MREGSQSLRRNYHAYRVRVLAYSSTGPCRLPAPTRGGLGWGLPAPLPCLACSSHPAPCALAPACPARPLLSELEPRSFPAPLWGPSPRPARLRWCLEEVSQCTCLAGFLGQRTHPEGAGLCTERRRCLQAGVDGSAPRVFWQARASWGGWNCDESGSTGPRARDRNSSL